MTTAAANQKRPVPTTLDPSQRMAVEAPEGPIILVGSPGSGKTHVLISRIAKMLRSQVSPYTITYMTFSARGAELARSLLENREDTKEHALKLFVGTIHTYASQFLRRAGHQVLGISPHFTLWDHHQALQIVTEIVDELEEVNAPTSELSSILHWNAANQARYSEDPLPANAPHWHQIIELYTQQKRRQNALDLDDLVPLAIQAMEYQPELREQWNRTRSRHLLVDEFQDITQSQYKLLQLATGPTGSICIATDPNQSIYGWRGADARLTEQFRLDNSKTHTYLLDINHRSTSTLNQFAVRISQEMSGLHQAPQKAIRSGGPVPKVWEFDQPNNIMDAFLLHQCQELHESGVPWEDIAIVYRRHDTIHRLNTMLVGHNIPHQIMGEPTGERHASAKALVNLLACVINPNDLQALNQATALQRHNQSRPMNYMVSREIYKRAQERKVNLIQAAEQEVHRYDPNSRIYHSLRYAVSAWNQLNRSLQDPEITLEAICKEGADLLASYHRLEHQPADEPDLARILALAATTPRMIPEENRQYLARFLELLNTAAYPEHRNVENEDPFVLHQGLTLATIHAAKGMQWKHVWVLDAADHIIPGNMPHESQPTHLDRLEEEQRIFYVASTRATDTLHYFVGSQSGRGQQATTSRFLIQIEPELDWTSVSAEPEQLGADSSVRPIQTAPLNAGEQQ